jgi:hypothetical protein
VAIRSDRVAQSLSRCPCPDPARVPGVHPELEPRGCHLLEHRHSVLLPPTEAAPFFPFPPLPMRHTFSQAGCQGPLRAWVTFSTSGPPLPSAGGKSERSAVIASWASTWPS